MPQTFQFGLNTFGDVTYGPDGTLRSPAEAIRHVVEEAVLADELGLDCFGVGEHHRADFAVSAPEVVLAAIAARTSRLVLGSAVTVLSTDDPVRVFERFSTLDAISNGRAEVILGRGSFTESYPLFGYDLSRYDELFEDKLALFAALLEGGPVTWKGTTRSALSHETIYPPIEAGRRLRAWVGVGGSPESVVRAARYGLPLTLAIIGGSPSRFRPYVDLYYESLEKFGKPRLPVAVHSPGHVAATDAEAREQLWPHYEAMMTRIGRERGWPPVTRAHFDREAGDRGALCVGSPETVAAKIVETVKTLGLSRFDLKYSNGSLPHERLMESVALVGREVAPRVRGAVGALGDVG
ncbi:MAG: LLM class flavin-dependent oxidoreductase [Vicinamibacterales bacterium]